MKLLEEALKTIAQQASFQIEEALVAAGKEQGSRIPQNLASSISLSKDGATLELSLPTYAKYINDGRPAKTKRVPITALIAWLQQKAIISGNRNLRDMAFAIQTEIFKRGIAPSPFFEIAEEGINEHAEVVISEAWLAEINALTQSWITKTTR